MAFETDLLTGIADLLVAKSIGAWKPTGAYTSGETGIVLDLAPQDPDNIIALSDYVVSDDPSLSDSVIGVQVVTRWTGQDPRLVKDLDSRIFDVLHGMPATDLATGVHIVSCFRRSGVSLGQDASTRWSRSSNYYVTVHRPSTNRT